MDNATSDDADDPLDSPAASAALEPARSQSLDDLQPDSLPMTRLTAAAPSAPARGMAFGSIIIGGVCGALIGYAFTDLQCENGCTAWAGISGIVGALLGAVGVAVVAILVLRAMDEWESVKDREPHDHPARKPPDGSPNRR